ncbi:MAG: hypothetical protein AAFR81_25195 [Chloroflexota bacterium]
MLTPLIGVGEGETLVFVDPETETHTLFTIPDVSGEVWAVGWIVPAPDGYE